MSDQDQNLPELNVQAAIESLLFIAPGPVTSHLLAETIEISVNQVEEALAMLASRYNEDFGLRLQMHGGRYQLTTAPELAALAEKFLGLDATSKLSRAALEALAIIAYKQPVTRPGIDAVRGVNSDGVLKSLLNKGLVQEVGRAEAPGRPILYGTTSEFLQHFGLDSLQKLPNLEPLDQDEIPETVNVLKE